MKLLVYHILFTYDESCKSLRRSYAELLKQFIAGLKRQHQIAGNWMHYMVP